MMHDRPSGPEYCQGIFEAAKELVTYHQRVLVLGELTVDELDDYLKTSKRYIDNLKRALEGKG